MRIRIYGNVAQQRMVGIGAIRETGSAEFRATSRLMGMVRIWIYLAAVTVGEVGAWVADGFPAIPPRCRGDHGRSLEIPGIHLPCDNYG